MLRGQGSQERTNDTQSSSSSNGLPEIFGGVAAVTFLLLLYVIYFFKYKNSPEVEINPVKPISFPLRYNFKTSTGIYRVPALDTKLASISEESTTDENDLKNVAPRIDLNPDSNKNS